MSNKNNSSLNLISGFNVSLIPLLYKFENVGNHDKYHLYNSVTELIFLNLNAPLLLNYCHKTDNDNFFDYSLGIGFSASSSEGQQGGIRTWKQLDSVTEKISEFGLGYNGALNIMAEIGFNTKLKNNNIFRYSLSYSYYMFNDVIAEYEVTVTNSNNYVYYTNGWIEGFCHCFALKVSYIITSKYRKKNKSKQLVF